MVTTIILPRVLRNGLAACCFLLSLLICALFGQAAVINSMKTEVISTTQGKFIMSHRTPALETDVLMPIFSGGELVESQVYRVRDRKAHDLLLLVRIHKLLQKPATEVQQYYLTKLGKTAAQQTDKDNGEITITIGEKEHFRLVVITPNKDGCDLLLERVQQFTPPSRIYTATEQQAIRVIKNVAATYRTAQRISYDMIQQVSPQEKGAQQPPALTWKVNFTPSFLDATARVGNTQALHLSVEKDVKTAQTVLRVHRQQGKDELRPIKDKITLDTIPEMSDDPVIALALGNEFINDQLDYLTIQQVRGISNMQQTEVTLTYPDRGEVQHFFIDLQRTQLLRCITEVTDDGDKTITTRTYTNVRVEAK